MKVTLNNYSINYLKTSIIVPVFTIIVPVFTFYHRPKSMHFHSTVLIDYDL